MPIRIASWSPRDGVLVVEIGGDVDLITAPEINEFLRARSAEDVQHLAIDLRGVTFLGSAGISMLIRELHRVDQDHELHLLGVAGNPRVGHVLELTGVTKMFSCYPGLSELLGDLDRP
jgi:anti-sigma B factor antagonist